jgi:TolB-like protein/Tfp pilus assembly protein PilF
MSVGSAVIRTPDQRLRVFVSSTMQELARERGAAVEAIQNLKLTPVLFELGARPHPPRELYRAYLKQSHVFVGVYGEQYGWIAPGTDISGLEDEYLLADRHPKLIYVKDPAPNRDDRLKDLLQRIEQHDRACYKTFSSPEELGTLLANDLAVLLSERFETSRDLEQAPAAPASAAQRSGERRLRRWGIAVVSAGVAVSTLLGLWLNQRAAPPDKQTATAEAGAPVAEATSIAVLPFVNMSPDPDQEYFSDGLSEELLNVLSRIPQLRVISRTSSFQFKDKSEDVRTIARKLNVAHVLEGSVRKSGRRIRVTAQLVKASDGSHLWSQSYDRELGDIFAVQDDIARSVADASKVTLLGRDMQLATSRSDNFEAYNLYLQGKYFADRQSRENLEKAASYYEQALKLDPGYARAWAGLARVHITQADRGYVPFHKADRNAREAVKKALEFDPNLAEAYAALGWMRTNYDWDWPGADAAFKRALELEPQNASVVRQATVLAATLGRFEDAIEQSRRAAELDPLNASTQVNLGNFAYYAGRLDEAEAAVRKGLELNPQYPLAHLQLGQIYFARSNPKAALAEMEQEKEPIWRRFGLALAYHALGRKKEADAALAGC